MHKVSKYSQSWLRLWASLMKALINAKIESMVVRGWWSNEGTHQWENREHGREKLQECFPTAKLHLLKMRVRESEQWWSPLTYTQFQFYVQHYKYAINTNIYNIENYLKQNLELDKVSCGWKPHDILKTIDNVNLLKLYIKYSTYQHTQLLQMFYWFLKMKRNYV